MTSILPTPKSDVPHPDKPDLKRYPAVLKIEKLTRNVNDNHLRAIFSNLGRVVNTHVEIHPKVKLSLSWGTITFATMKDARNAYKWMNGGQIDGQAVKLSFYNDALVAQTRDLRDQMRKEKDKDKDKDKEQSQSSNQNNNNQDELRKITTKSNDNLFNWEIADYPCTN